MPREQEPDEGVDGVLAQQQPNIASNAAKDRNRRNFPKVFMASPKGYATAGLKTFGKPGEKLFKAEDERKSVMRMKNRFAIMIMLMVAVAICLFGCTIPGLGGGSGKNCTTSIVNKSVCKVQTVHEPYTVTGNCTKEPYEAQDCTDEPILLDVGSPSMSSTLHTDPLSCSISLGVTVSNPEPDPVTLTMNFNINNMGEQMTLSDTQTIKARSSQDFRVHFPTTWDCVNNQKKPTVELQYENPTKQVCKTAIKLRDVCQNTTQYKDVEKDVCTPTPTEVKVC